MNLASAAEFRLDEKDVRAIVRLLGNVIAHRGDINVSRRMLMDGLCSLVDAHSWLWCVANMEPGKPLSHSDILYGGFDDEKFSWFLQAINHPALANANIRIASELQQRGAHITRNLTQIEAPAYPLFKSDAGPYWEKADIGTLMLSLRPIETGGATGIGLYRKRGAADFDDREMRIAHILLTEVSWLHFHSFPDRNKISRLYPRHKTILNLLCDGWDRKKIAAHLGISVQTVHGYVKQIFRHFDVHSQSELITRLAKGDGGDL
ncbi:MAG: helix-turn-helix transcriptional regulator [Luteolibacter sp.]